MKVSLNTINAFNKRYHCTEDVTALGLTELVDRIGAQLGAVESVEPYGQQFEGILIVNVVKCQPHPNADKLHICEVDDGKIAKGVERTEQGTVQVVCGAPNIREGLKAVWLPPGVTVPATIKKDPFVLTAKEIRGVRSNGMLASASELGLGDDHSGIVAVDKDVTPGTSFAAAFDLEGDVILDLENKMFTHRPDCFGFMGIARELAGIQGMVFKSPDWYALHPTLPQIKGEELKLNVHNELPELVVRFSAIAMRGVSVGPSPLWLQVELSKVGQKPINNIVDYTNFYMLMTGQPLHAYDYDKVKELSGSDSASIVVRYPRPGETIKLINGKTVTPEAETIMIATDQQLIGIGGVMGGAETEVSATTSNLIIECANFDMYSVRRAAMAHGLFTDAVTRFTKGQSPLQTPPVLAAIAAEIQAKANGMVASSIIDNNEGAKALIDRGTVHPPVSINTAFINERLGLNLSAQDMSTLLSNVECQVGIEDDRLRVMAPFWRTDIELREDVAEEIGRLYGFDKLPLDLPKRDISPVIPNPLLKLKADIRNCLSAAGANEVLTYSFVHGNLLQKTSEDVTKAYQLANALSPDLQYYRLSLTPSLLNSVHSNIKAGYDHFALFEMGKVHRQGEMEDDIPKEFERIAFIIAADTKAAKANFKGPAYYEAKFYLEMLLTSCGLAEDVRYESELRHQEDESTLYYAPGRSAYVYLAEERVGVIGEYTPQLLTSLKLPDFCGGFELDLELLLKRSHPKRYTPLSRFPKLTQDITLAVSSDITYQELFHELRSEVEKAKSENTACSLQPLDIYEGESNSRHITFRLAITSYDRTLKDDEVQQLLNIASSSLQKSLKTEQI
jgi:phenylalanyl-tRNA synthetase beta chain